MDPELACGLATDLNDALDAGYAEATVVSFNTWRDMCETQNNAIPQALGKLTDTLLAGKYALATSALNGEVRSDLKHAMKAAHAAGNLVRTVAAIKEALASAEAAAIARSAAVGEALLRSLLHLLMAKSAHQIMWGQRVVRTPPCVEPRGSVREWICMQPSPRGRDGRRPRDRLRRLRGRVDEEGREAWRGRLRARLRDQRGLDMLPRK